MRLIIAEKPDMGRKIAKALPGPHKNGQGFIETGGGIVTWCIGHIMKSFEPKEYNAQWEKWNLANLPMLITDWKIKIDSTKASQFKVIKELLAKSSEVINAGDPGREGQLIVDEVLYYLKNKKPVKRILLYSLDAKYIQQAFNNLEDNSKFYNLYEAAVCRGFADWTLGMNGTVLFTLNAQKSGYKGVLSVGRVQSPTLAIVVRRDEEIEHFVVKEYWIVLGEFEHNGHNFKAYWRAQEGITPANWIDEEQRLISQQAASDIVNKIKNKQGTIKSYEETEGKELPPLPFNLSKIQIYANAKWGMSAKDVLETCQSLYEKHELQTYPRTDCQYLPENQLPDAKEILSHISKSNQNLAQAVQGANTSLKSSAWNDQKLGEHFGLIPTKKQADLSQLNDKEKKIYQAVCERYIAQFYPPCEYKSASLVIECEKEIFKANGKVITKQGWRAIFNNEEEQEDNTSDEEEQVFPELKEGEIVNCDDGQAIAKKTKPPPYFTEGTLIKAMTSVHTLVQDPEQKKKLKEKKGIGQEATRTQIIENLFNRTLLVRNGKKINSSQAGKVLVHSLPKKITDPALTAVWEDALDKIAEGKISADVFKQKQNQWITQLVEENRNIQISQIENISSKSNTSKPKTSVKPNFKSNQGANNFNSSNASAKKQNGNTCPKCKKGSMVEKTAKASGKKFLGCSNWPNCNHVEWPKK